MAKKFLTLNIGAATVELAEYSVSGSGALTLLNYGTAALEAPLDAGDPETILKPALQEIVRASGIRPGPVAISLPGQMVFPKFAAIPMAGGSDKFEQLVRYEVEQNIPFPIDEMVCDRQVLGETEDGDQLVMIVAAKVDQVEAITAAVSAVGFRPELVDVAPIALTNAIRTTLPEEGACIVALDIGSRTTSLIIVEGDRFYNRSIPVAGHSVTKEIAQALGCSIEEAEQFKLERGYVSLGGVTEDADETTDLISKACRAVMGRLQTEISRSINFYRSQQHGGAPTKLFLTGGTALLPQIDQFFAEALQIEVEFFNPLTNIGLGAKVDAEALETDAACLASTVGLAYHQAGAAYFAINLLPPSILAARAEKAKIPPVAFGCLCLIGALVLTLLGVRHQTEVLQARMEGIGAETQRFTTFDRQVKAATEKLSQAQAEAEEVKQVLSAHQQAVARVNAVRDSLLPGMWIEKWENGSLTIRSWKDRVKGDGGKTVSELVVARLKAKSVIDAASVRIANMSSLAKDQVEQFVVEFKYK